MADRISNLPNEILCHILSFLPTKASVATCVLSKRWKLLWRSVPVLHFDDTSENNICKETCYSRFVKSVYAFITLRDWHQPLQRFHVRCPIPQAPVDSYMNFNAWVTATTQRSVECREISLHSFNGLPSDLLSCKTLVILKLTDTNIEYLSSVDFPSLKILHFNLVYFSQLKDLAEFLSGTPNLEVLEAINLSLFSHEMEAKFKRLPKLVRAVIVRFIVPLEVVDNVRFLRINSVDHLWSDIEEQIPEFYNLTHIEMGSLEYTRDWLDVLELLKHCPKLQNFTIDENYIEEWFSGDEGNLHYPPYVPQCISLHLKTCCLRRFCDTEAEFEIAKYIMKNARQLQDMTICSSHKADESTKLDMLKKLSLCTRISSTCKLTFN